MVLSSGTQPYEYAAQTPLRVPDYLNAGSGPRAIGPSGLLMEQAYFVLLAEWRRYRGHGSAFEPAVNKYVHEDLPKEGIEPRSNGENLASGLATALTFINHISDARIVANDVFGFVQSDSDYTTAQIKSDWLIQTYRTPSGIILGEWYHSDDLSPGRIPISEHFLGGSGVLFDVDLGEVMYNPYPRLADFSQGDTRPPGGGAGNLGSFDVITGPIFPGFQKKDGSLITPNIRDTSFEGGHNNDNFDLRFIDLSGVIRMDGDVLTDLTDYFLGGGNKFDDTVTPAFTFSDGSTRRPFVGDEAVPQTRVFVTPIAQSSGANQVVCVNRRTDFPNTAIESGIISAWPPIANAYPNHNIVTTFSNFNNDAYEVFDDCFWVVDIPGPGGFFDQRQFPPSGLGVVSPFTGRSLWVRRAADNVTSHAIPGEVSAWPNLVGLERIATNSIYRIAEDLSGSSPTHVVHFMQYDDDLDFVAEHLSTGGYGASPAANEMQDMWHDGTDFFVIERVNGIVGQFDGATFAFIERFFAGFTVAGHRGAAFNSKQWQYRPGLSGIFEVTYSAGATTNVGIKNILVPPNLVHNGVGNADSANIEDILEVTGASEIPNGVWAIIEFVKGASAFPYLVKIREESTVFEVEAVIPLIVSNYNERSDRGNANRFYDFLAMDIT